MLSFGEFKRTPYFAGLDLLRGLSILLVVWHHGLLLAPGALLQGLQHNARHGVALFFTISGFLIASLLLREREETGRIRLGRFYMRRGLRLFPLYYLMLVIQALLVLGADLYSPASRALFQDKAWSYVFYYSNWLETAGEGPFFQSWSLATEEQFYLLFAAAVVWVRPQWLPGAIVGLLGWKMILFSAAPEIEALWPVARALLSYQEPILLGVLLAYALNNRAIYEAASRFVGPLLPVAFGVVALLLAGRPTATYTGWDAQVIYIAMTVLVASCVVRRRVAFPGAGAFAYLGKISYGIYLLHMLVIAAAKKVPFIDDPYTCFVATVVVVVPIAAWVYEWFEAPIIRFYKKRYGATAGSAPPFPAGRFALLLPRI